MPDTAAQRPGPRRSFLHGVFGLVLALYAFFIVGIIAADFLMVAGTPLGRAQFMESIRSADVRHAIRLSLWTSTVSALISLFIAVPAGYMLSRRKGPWFRALDALVDVPIILPPVLFGISLLVLFQRSFVGPALLAVGLKFVHEPAGILLVQVLISTAFGLRMMKGAFDGLDARLPAVARTLGCSPGGAFFRVSLPTVRHHVVAAFVMMWAWSMALYGPIIAFVGATSGHTEVLPVRMYLEMSIGRLEAALAIALILIAIGAVVLVIVKWAGGGRSDDMARMTEL